MPTISPAVNFVAVQTHRIPRVTWPGMATGDTIVALPVAGNSIVAGSVQFAGTFGSATVKLQVSNDGTTFFDMKDASGTTISATAAGIFTFTTSALYIRPAIAGGTSDSVDAIVCLRV